MIDYGDVTHPRNRRLHTPPESPEEDSRNPAQRDRDRILYASAFRRLAEVTQVASPDHAHVFHNRLTHSLQVAQVGRSLAQKLRQGHPSDAIDEIGGIDPDVVEAACMAHDIGHPPFGHAAEEELNALAGKAVGGFEGNAQSFRVVTKLAFKSENYSGLDLTRATLAAILKYPWGKGENPENPKKWGVYSSESTEFEFARELGPQAPLKRTAEAELMNWADDVTYAAHDIEDFYRAGLIPMHLLARYTREGKRFIEDNLERQRFFDDVYRRHAGEKDFFGRADLQDAFADVLWTHWDIAEPYSGTKEQRSKLRYFTAQLIHRYVNCVELAPTAKSVYTGDSFLKEIAVLKELTWTYVIEAPALAAQHEGQRAIIRRLFDVYSDAAASEKKWILFPHYYRDELQNRPPEADRARLVVDLIAGMTEPQAIATYRQFTGTWPSSSLEEIVR